MKRFRCAIVFFSMLYPLCVCAGIENTYCYDDNKSECEVVLKKNKENDLVDYSVVLIDSHSANQLFPESEENSTMESVSLYKKIIAMCF